MENRNKTEKMCAHSQSFLRCGFGKRYIKRGVVFCFILANVLLLRTSYFDEIITGTYTQTSPKDVEEVFTDENTPVTFNDKKQNLRTIFHKTSKVNRVILRTIQNITLKPETARQLAFRNNSKTVTIEKPYLIENPDLCSSVENLSAVIMVHTAPSNFEKRMAIRRTWGNNSYYSDLGTVRTLFLMGLVSNRDLQLDIEREFKKFGDVVQGAFVDSYYNMTFKGVMGYKWLSERCQNAKIILKVDDDVIVNMFTFLKHFAPTFLSNPRHIACRRLHRGKIERRKGSKWAIDNGLFKGQHFYPNFCQGFMVAISNDVIPDLLSSASVTPFFWIDDIFLYGLVPNNVPKLKYTNLAYGKRVIWGAGKGIKCYQRRNCEYLVIFLWSDIPQNGRNMVVDEPGLQDI